MSFRIKVLSRHPSHSILRTRLPRLERRALVRFGSTTQATRGEIEINSIDSIKISSNKKLMKEKFDQAEAKTALWTSGNNIKEVIASIESKGIEYPVVAKSLYGSRGEGNTKIDSENELHRWANGKTINRYIFEKYHNYTLEYRLHVTRDGCFYACRKALKRDTPTEDRWRRHVDTSVWLLETNENFRRPSSWNDIINHCVNALVAIGADVLSFDVKVQSERTKDGKARKTQDFILLECNSASSMQSPSDMETSICAQKYIEMLPQLIRVKIRNSGGRA